MAAEEEKEPEIANASWLGLAARSFNSASRLFSDARHVLAADRRRPDEIPAWEQRWDAIGGTLQMLAEGGIGGAVAEGVATRAASSIAESALSRGLQRAAMQKAASTVAGKVAQRAGSLVADNVALQLLPIAGRAADLSEKNGKGVLRNLPQAGEEALAGLERSLNLNSLRDPKVSPYDKAQTAILWGSVLFGAGLKGYDGIVKSAEQYRIDPALVERAKQYGQRSAKVFQSTGRPMAQVWALVSPELLSNLVRRGDSSSSVTDVRKIPTGGRAFNRTNPQAATQFTRSDFGEKFRPVFQRSADKTASPSWPARFGPTVPDSVAAHVEFLATQHPDTLVGIRHHNKVPNLAAVPDSTLARLEEKIRQRIALNPRSPKLIAQNVHNLEVLRKEAGRRRGIDTVAEPYGSFLARSTMSGGGGRSG